MNQTIFKIAAGAALAAGLAACGTVDPYGPNNYPVSPSAGAGAPAYYNQTAAVEYGRITNVQLVSNGTTASNGNTTAGTLIGGVLGGVLGNQVGHGNGRAAATILGAVGGAAVGNNIARNSQGPAYNSAGPVYRVWVQTDQGITRTYDVSAVGDLRVGDRVRVENGVIYMS